VVTGGGLSPEGKRWVPTRRDYLLPVRVLSRLFRGKFLAGLQRACDEGLLELKGSTAPLSDPEKFAALKRQLYRQEWVVYAKPPFAGVEHVYHYLGRYTHRVAISNSRLLGMRDGRVRFRYKDYSDGCRQKVMELDAEEFLRRFLLHVLPKRFVRIRHYGLLASRNVSTKLEAARQLLVLESGPREPASQNTTTWPDVLAKWLEETFLICPRCGDKMIRSPLETHDPNVPLDIASFPAHQPVPILDSS
jgi:hypothetical protein